MTQKSSKGHIVWCMTDLHAHIGNILQNCIATNYEDGTPWRVMFKPRQRRQGPDHLSLRKVGGTPWGTAQARFCRQSIIFFLSLSLLWCPFIYTCSSSWIRTLDSLICNFTLEWNTFIYNISVFVLSRT